MILMKLSSAVITSTPRWFSFGASSRLVRTINVTRAVPRMFLLTAGRNESNSRASKILLGIISCRGLSDTKTGEIRPENEDEMTPAAADLCDKMEELLSTKCNVPNLPAKELRCNIVSLLLLAKVPKESVLSILSERPVLLTYPISAWQETIALLKSYSFNSDQILPVVANCTSLLDGSSRQTLHNVLTLLRSLEVREGKRQQIILKNPRLLSVVDTRTILNRYFELLKIFTKAELLSLMVSNPAVLTDSWEETEEKINYVYDRMGIRSKEITKSRLFEHSMLHIVSRHKFAERAGFYHMPNKHEIAAVEANKTFVSESANPSLHRILDSSDTAFACSIGNLTLDEYQVFKEMIKSELEDVSDTDDSDSDTSDDENSYNR